MGEMEKNAALLKEIQARMERKLKDGEIEIVEYWKEQIDRVAAMQPEGIAALQQQLKKISEMMGNRVRTIKKDLSH
ncbi:MAG: hypothetical protein K0B01_01270 [Syntrophobacterales bacterium]|nr:hypothetical protein [Syntrophobacterales bacterium]